MWDDVDTNGDGALTDADASPYLPDFGQPIADLGTVHEGQTLQVDITAAVQSGPGVYTFAIKNRGTNGAFYSARETAREDQRPAVHLELTP